MSSVPIPLALLATLVGLWLLASLLAAHLQGLVLLLTRSGRAAAALYDLLVLPGVVVHEAAHIVAAVCLRVRVVRADFFRFRRVGDARQGEVIVEHVDPLRMSLIGAAPLLAGVPLVLLLLRALALPPLGLTLAAFEALCPLMREPFNLLGLYLVWAIANTMFPSAADRAAWWVVGVALAIGAALFAVTGQRPVLPEGLHRSLLVAAARLTGGLLPVLLLDLVLLVAIVCLEWLAGRLTGRRVVRS
jgi:hypothetical protein